MTADLAEIYVNDVHSLLNRTRVAQVVAADNVGAIKQAIAQARQAGGCISICGGRHAMGSQQFATDSILIDMTALNRIIALDSDRGIVEVEAGIVWSKLIAGLSQMQGGAPSWAIRQKPTGADDITIGGSLSANVHGRGLRMQPFVDDIEYFRMVDSTGAELTVSRQENPDIFQLAIGGYGLFGVVTAVALRLTPAAKLVRHVQVLGSDNLLACFNKHIEDGYVFGDFQFAIDDASPDFLQKGIFAAYKPVPPDTAIPDNQKALTLSQWRELLIYAHTDKARAFDAYAQHYLATHGQIYSADTMQLSTYLDDYHAEVDRFLSTSQKASEIITEIYVPRGRLVEFLKEAAECLRKQVDVIYGTIRLIEQDKQTYLAWASKPYACVIFNLHTVHDQAGIERSCTAFKRLIDLAIDRSGSYYLTYHKYADRRQVLACYPQMPDFLARKIQFDPEEVFQSNWYRHHRQLLA